MTIIIHYIIVFTLRLSPILPIPVAAYNYVYSITSVSTLDFLMGITLGSIKPYLLDCYLGLFGKSILDNPGTGFSSTEDYVLLGIVTLVIIVGTFAAQLATSTWKEIQNEIKLMTAVTTTTTTTDTTTNLIDGGNSINTTEVSATSGELGFFELLGITDSDLPKPLQV